MLKPRHRAGFRRCLDAIRLNFSLPFSLHSGDVLLIAAALGAIAGLSLFFHGFSLLQQRWPVPIHRPAKLAGPPSSLDRSATTPEENAAGSASSAPRTVRPEIIKLTPQDLVDASSASMTQQGRIAAALLKAGIPSPATWTHESMQVTVRVEDRSTSKPTTEAEVSRVLQQGANAADFSIPALNQTIPRHASNWKATVMIWGGPALALACIYIMAAHLGWL